jgi:hypothetical protein
MKSRELAQAHFHFTGKNRNKVASSSKRNTEPDGNIWQVNVIKR